MLRQAESSPKQRLGRCRAKADNSAWFDRMDLRLEPRPASGNLARTGLRVQSPLAALLPFEVLHRVRQVYRVLRNFGFIERLIKQPARRTDEWLSRDVFLIAGNFADEHYFCAWPALAENSLRRPFV